MTGLNACPAWCSNQYPVDDPRHVHASPVTVVVVGRAKSGIARLDPPRIVARAVLHDHQAPGQPFVLVLTTEGTSLGAEVQRRDADGLAAVIDTLAAATPAQHREPAAAIRQAAALTEGEVA